MKSQTCLIVPAKDLYPTEPGTRTLKALHCTAITLLKGMRNREPAQQGQGWRTQNTNSKPKTYHVNRRTVSFRHVNKMDYVSVGIFTEMKPCIDLHASDGLNEYCRKRPTKCTLLRRVDG